MAKRMGLIHDHTAKYSNMASHYHLQRLAHSLERSQGDQTPAFLALARPARTEHSEDCQHCLSRMPPAQLPHHQSRKVLQCQCPARLRHSC
jgi:hypothetical protein